MFLLLLACSRPVPVAPPEPGAGGIHDFGGAPVAVPEGLEDLAEALEAGRLSEASTLRAGLAGEFGEDPDFLALSGRLLHLQGRFREAASLYSEALALRPSDLSLVFRAFETEMYRDPRRAAAVAREALKSHPRMAALHVCLAEALVLSAVAWGDDTAREAEVEASRARRLGGLRRPDGTETGDVAAVLGEVAMLRGDLAAAREHFARALEMGIDNPDRGIDVANALGNVSYRLGDVPGAARAWRRGAEIWQGWDRLSFFRLTSKGEVLLYYLDVFCGEPITVEALDWMYEKDGDLLGRGFEDEPRYLEVRGWSYDYVRARDRGDWETAADRMLKLKGSGPVDVPRPGVEDVLCFYFYRVDAPMSVACDALLAGDAFWHLGRREEARAQYREALEILPGDEMVLRRLQEGPP